MPKEDENAEGQEVEELEGDEPEGNDNPDESEEEPTIEELKAQIAEKDKALKKANAERTRLGKKLKEAPKTGDKDQPEVPTLTDAAKRAFVVAELRAEGLTDAQAKRLARLASLDEIDLDDDGDVVGIDLDDIKEEFAALFEKSEGTPAKKNGGRKPVTGDKSGSANPPSGQSDVTKQMLKMAQVK